MFFRFIAGFLLILLSFLVLACSSLDAVSTESPTPSSPIVLTEIYPTSTVTVTIPGTESPGQPIEDIKITESPKVTPLPTPSPYQVIRNVPYVEGGDADQVLNIYLPEEEIRNDIVLLVLGGPNIYFLRDFAKLGYVGLEVHYSEGTMQRGVENAICALFWAHTNGESFGFSPSDIIVMGTSLYGAQAGLIGVLDDYEASLESCPHPMPQGELISGAITLAGVLDMVDREMVDGDDPPFLIVHGMEDDMIEYQQSEEFASALESAGVVVELILLPGVGHSGIMSNSGALSAMEEFLAAFIE